MKEFYQCSSCGKLICSEDSELATSGFIQIKTVSRVTAMFYTENVMNLTLYFCSEECMNKKLKVRKK